MVGFLFGDEEVIVIVGSMGRAEEPRAICGICGFVLSQVGGCPQCKLATQEDAKELKERQEMQGED